MVTESISDSDTFDLMAQSVTQGTGTPTRFKIVAMS